ncbi:MAG: APC family permease [Saprospiraceae bacterium]|nr:APC family permease [Saprospiraceae bacterium]MBK9222201.1 APC family permease [Saprospiraceae bacterium]MBK9720890.1 APC family permease [Saprospiraceae bacterium]MBK9727884.1 APC family permease [Saprospiraceae bacterium]
MDSNSSQKLGVYSLSMIVIGLVIGLGIFRAASVSANAAITPSVYFAAWIFGGLVALCGALTYAEIGSRFPVTGGYYKIFSVAYHPSIAFAINGIILVSNAASLGGVALIGSDYLAEVLFVTPPTDLLKSMIAIFAILAFYGVNLLGLRLSANTLNVLMFIKIAMILLIISALFFPKIHVSSNQNYMDWMQISWSDLISSFGATLVAVSFTYGGYQQTINFGDEIKSPRKTIPKSIYGGILLVIVLYLLVNLSYYKIIGFEELKTAKGIASIVASKLFGPIGRNLFAILLFLAVLAYVNVSLLSNPRVMYAMSLDGILPKSFSKKSGNKEVLTVSLTVFTLICVLVVFFASTFDRILGFVMILDSLGMATSAATIFYLRRKTKDLNLKEIYQIKFFPWVPIFFICAYTFVGISSFYLNPQFGFTAILVFIALIIAYFLIQKLKRNSI